MEKFEDLLNENVLNPQAQSLVNEWEANHKHVKQPEHDKVFGSRNHDLVIPMGNSTHHREINPHEIPEEVKRTVAKHGFAIHDYVNNVASRIQKTPSGEEREGRSSISKVLAREPGHIALEKFNADPMRQSSISKDHEIVISRDPQKVGRMTSSRRWCGAACTRLPGPEVHHPELASHIKPADMKSGGEFHHTIEQDIKHGTMIAYLVKKGDHAVENPLGRVLLKKHVAVDHKGNEIEGRHIWRPEFGHNFGSSPDNFKATVQHWAEKNYPALKSGERSMTYKKHPDLYNDEGDEKAYSTHFAPGHHEFKNSSFHANAEGRLHDPEHGSPAKIVHKPLESKTEEHYQNGVKHREGGLPQLTETSFTEKGPQITKQEWRERGLLHREGDKPAAVHTGRNGSKAVSYAKYGLMHRDHRLGPAYHTSTRSEYLMNGVHHRPVSEGPAIHDKYGDYSHHEFGEEVNPTHGGPAVKKGNSHEWVHDHNQVAAKFNTGQKLLTMTHSNGDVETFSKARNKYTRVDDNGIHSSEMLPEHHAKYDEYENRAARGPKEFKPHEPA